MLKAIWLFVLLAQSGIVAAQTSDKEMQEFYRALDAKNFAGWKGITFICEYDERDSLLAEVCIKGTADFRFLATTADIDYYAVAPNDFRASTFRSTISDHVVLNYELHSTLNNNQHTNKAIFGRLSFIEFYTNAVEEKASNFSLDKLPRSGDLELWSRAVIGSRSSVRLVAVMSEAFEVHFKDAITHFLEHGSSRK
jgi:hypothetical protein